MSNHFLFIEGNTTGTGALAVRRLLAQEDRVTFLASRPEKYPVLATPSPGLDVVRMDTNDLAAVLRKVGEIDRRAKVDAVLTFSEFYVPAAAEVAARLGFRYLNPAAAHICRSKPETRRALRAAGLPVPGLWPVATADEAAQVVAALSYPAVVKPPSDSSSEAADRLGYVIAMAAAAEGALRALRIHIERPEEVPAGAPVITTRGRSK